MRREHRRLRIPFGFFHILGAGVENQFQQAFFVDGSARNQEQPTTVKHPGYAPGPAEVPTVNFKHLSQFSSRPVPVLRERIAENSNACGAVAFINKLFVIIPVAFPTTLLNRAINVLCWHAVLASLVNRISQRQIHVRVATAMLRSHDNRSAELAEQLTAFLVDPRFLGGDVRPMRVACHSPAS